MAIPTNINPLRWWAAVVGMKFDGMFTHARFEAAFFAFADILGIDEQSARELGCRAVSYFQEELVHRFTASSAALSMDKHSDFVVTELKRLVDSLPPEQMHDYASRLDAWINPRVIISANDFEHLQPYIVLNWILRANPDEWMKACVTKTRITLRPFIATRADQVRQALTMWSPIADPTTLDGRNRLQTQGRILHKMVTGVTEKATGSELERNSLDNLMSGWSSAYETTIFHVCTLLWMATRKPNEPSGLGSLPGYSKGRVTKGAVYTELVKWFAQTGLEFPFHQRLNEIRNSLSHGSWSFDDERRLVHFGTEGDPRTISLSFDEVTYHATHDIGMASHFHHGLILAILDRDNQEGRLDAAWHRFEEAAGELKTVCDDNAPDGGPFGSEFEDEPLHVDPP